MIDPRIFVTTINAEAEAGRMFWVAGLASEVHSILYPLRSELHPDAAAAVIHYHQFHMENDPDA